MSHTTTFTLIDALGTNFDEDVMTWRDSLTPATKGSMKETRNSASKSIIEVLVCHVLL
jgi:hypothetical protein